MLRHGMPYVDVSQHAYDQQYRERVVKNLKRNARTFGFTLVPLEGSNPDQAVATP